MEKSIKSNNNRIHLRTLFPVLSLTLLLWGCLPDENKAPDQASDAGKLSGTYFGTALGNTAVLIQNAVVTSPAWFNAINGQSIDLASIGLDPKVGTPVGNAVCPAGGGTPRVTLLTWLDSRKPDNTFLLKGVSGGVGEMMGSLRTQVAMNQLGTYEANGTIRLADGTAMSIPSSCPLGALNIPVGAPVIAFVADRPSAPISEMTRTEYRTRPCGNDPISGLPQKGTMVESRKVGFKSDGTIVTYVAGSAQPYDAALGWSAEAMGQCIPDISVEVSNTAKLQKEASASLNAFADMAAQGMRNVLQSQLEFDCVKASISSKTVNEKTGQLVKADRTIDSCRKTALANSGATNVDTLVDNPVDVRNLCPRTEQMPRRMLGGVDGIFAVNMAGSAIVRRTVDQINSTTDTVARGNKRYVWQGGQNSGDVSCSGREQFTANCGAVPGAPTGKREDTTVEKWISKTVGELDDYLNIGGIGLLIAGGMMYYQAAAASASVLGPLGFILAGLLLALFGWQTSPNESRAWLFNYNYLDTIHTYHSSSDTTRAQRDLSASTWKDPYNYFIANFNLPAGTLGWYVPATANACRIMERENQRTCPQSVDAAKTANWTPKSLSKGLGFQITILPGGNYGDDEAGKIYNNLRNAGYSVGLVQIKQTTKLGCGFLWLQPCTRWFQAGPGTGAYLESWMNYSGTSSVTGGTTTVQTILLNQDGQKKDWTPTILKGPVLKYQYEYVEPLKCGRIENKVIAWPLLTTSQDCSGKGGCRTVSSYSTIYIEERVVREWEGESATKGSWSRPLTIYTSAYGSWNSISRIPNPITVSY